MDKERTVTINKMIAKWTTLLEQGLTCDCGEKMVPTWHSMSASESLTAEVVYHCEKCGVDRNRETVVNADGEVVSDEVLPFFFG